MLVSTGAGESLRWSAGRNKTFLHSPEVSGSRPGREEGTPLGELHDSPDGWFDLGPPCSPSWHDPLRLGSWALGGVLASDSMVRTKVCRVCQVPPGPDVPSASSTAPCATDASLPLPSPSPSPSPSAPPNVHRPMLVPGWRRIQDGRATCVGWPQSRGWPRRTKRSRRLPAAPGTDSLRPRPCPWVLGLFRASPTLAPLSRPSSTFPTDGQNRASTSGGRGRKPFGPDQRAKRKVALG